MHASGSSVFLFFLTIAELAVFLEYRSRDCDFGESFWFHLVWTSGTLFIEQLVRKGQTFQITQSVCVLPNFRHSR